MALDAIIAGGQRIEGHRPFPCVVIDAQAWQDAAGLLAAQDQGQQQQGQQDIPDAPSAVRPVQPFPSNLPPSRPQPQPVVGGSCGTGLPPARA